jgi:hypothetical protein
VSRLIHRLAAAGIASVALCALALPADAAAATWHGAFDRSAPTKLTFQYSGSRVTRFTIPTVGCTSVNGYQNETIFIPSIAVHHGRFSINYHPPKAPSGVKTRVKGRISGKRASGTVYGKGLCTTGPQPFHANQGRFRPVKAPKSKQGACSMSRCVTSDGALIRVTGVDRTIASVADPSNIYDSDADPNLPAGVAVTIAGSDRSAHDPFLEPGFSSLKLRLGSGVLSDPYGTNSTVVSANGSSVACSDPYDQQTLTRGASFGPITVCFAVPRASDRQHLTLEYMPSGTRPSKIRLG